MRAAAFAATIATAVAGGALVAPAAGAQGSSNDPAPTFYQPPTDLPAASGELIKTEPFPLAAAIPPIPGADSISDAAGPLSTDAQRIMYTSVGSRDQAIAVTGAYLQPRAP
ncbi:lipase, partial [Dietzia maris]|nr:lipase [Dietzia maris]